MKALNDDLQMRSDWHMSLCASSKRFKINGNNAHAAQKPEALLCRILLVCMNIGDVVLDPFFRTGTTGIAAKILGRHWIGIERDEEFIEIAKKRIAAVQSAPEVAPRILNPRLKKRIPFSALLDSGLLKLRQHLFFARDGTAATILADGYIHCGNQIGSIHSLAKYLLNAPANSWEQWLFKDETGQQIPINQFEIGK